MKFSYLYRPLLSQAHYTSLGSPPLHLLFSADTDSTALRRRQAACQWMFVSSSSCPWFCFPRPALLRPGLGHLASPIKNHPLLVPLLIRTGQELERQKPQLLRPLEGSRRIITYQDRQAETWSWEDSWWLLLLPFFCIYGSRERTMNVMPKIPILVSKHHHHRLWKKREKENSDRRIQLVWGNLSCHCVLVLITFIHQWVYLQETRESRSFINMAGEADRVQSCRSDG